MVVVEMYVQIHYLLIQVYIRYEKCTKKLAPFLSGPKIVLRLKRVLKVYFVGEGGEFA